MTVVGPESAGDDRPTASKLVCTSCRAHASNTAKFCSECGARLQHAAHSAEYKHVTVLFADVVGSMGLATTLEGERLREVMTEVVQRSASVARRLGGIVEHNGDGVMAVFGAPVALEDHAVRACRAALAIQDEMARLAAEVQRRDHVALSLRVGLDSGRVIAGDSGAASFGYTTTGQHVGFAKRMESIAPAGGVMLSESTARLVEHTALLSDAEWLHIKGADAPVRGRRLLAIPPRRDPMSPTEAALVGRDEELATLEALQHRMSGGTGCIANVVGSPGVGKSRLARELAAKARIRGADVYWIYCESHGSDVPFAVVTRLLRTAAGVAKLDAETARIHLHQYLPDADALDLMLLDDLLGIADLNASPPRIDPDARRRRLSALLNSLALARTGPVLYLLEDVHWIDEVSETMIAEMLAVISRIPSMVVITARPEYDGALMRVDGSRTVKLEPLSDADTDALIGQLLGSDPSVGEVRSLMTERAAGNPFFAEEMVRELAQRGTLVGALGHYTCETDVGHIAVPATVQATIAARIDRLSVSAKETLNAAAVIGARFGAPLLATLMSDAAVDELIDRELVDRVSNGPEPEFAFRHPLIRAVAYESQLRSSRCQVHRRVASAIESCDPQRVEDNATLIAEHLEAGGELRAAYAWHMRAGARSTHRDIAAARVNWYGARRIADALPEDDVERTAMRIAPRTMLCVSAWRSTREIGLRLFDELREICTSAGDEASLAVAMTGPIVESLLTGQPREASRLAAEQIALLESIGDPTLIIAASYVAVAVKGDTGEMNDVLRWTQRVIDLAEGDPIKGAAFGIGSPLAAALVWRGIARYWLGLDGWRQDLTDSVAMARESDAATHALVVAYKNLIAIQNGVLTADKALVRELEEALGTAEGLSGDTALGLVQGALAGVLLLRDEPEHRERGLALLAHVRETWLRDRSRLYLIPIGDVYAARERARRGNRDGAIPIMRDAVEQMYEAGRHGYGVPVLAVFVETLLERGHERDLTEAQDLVERLANLPADDRSMLRDIWLLRLRALLARAQGDDLGYHQGASHYRAMAESLGFEGHIAWSEEMTERGQ